MVLQLVNTALQETLEVTGGVGRVVTAPAAQNRSLSTEVPRFLRNTVGTVLDGVLIVPSVAVLYTLLSRDRGHSRFRRLGTGTLFGLIAFAASYGLRKVV